MISYLLYVALYLLVGTALAFAYMVFARIHDWDISGAGSPPPAEVILLLYPIVIIIVITGEFCKKLKPLVDETIDNLKRLTTTSEDD